MVKCKGLQQAGPGRPAQRSKAHGPAQAIEPVAWPVGPQAGWAGPGGPG